MYYGEKLNAREIAGVLNVSLDAVYSFMRRNRLARRSMREQNWVRFDKKEPSFNLKNKFSVKDKYLLIAGVMLYWAEGFQSDAAHTVDFANSKPEMVAVFMAFLRRICGVNEGKLRAYLYCYSNQDVGDIISFWSKLTKISRSQFTKPYIRSDFRQEKIGKMKYGLFHVRYADKKLLNKIREWINVYSSELQ